MSPGSYPLNLYRGDSGAWEFVCWADAGKTQPADLTGATAKAEIRASSGGAMIMALRCAINASTVSVTLDATMWDAWTTGTKGVWDLQLTWVAPEPIVQTIVAGAVTVALDVTDSVAVPGAGRGR